jgi:hypothetical protein
MSSASDKPKWMKSSITNANLREIFDITHNRLKIIFRSRNLNAETRRRREKTIHEICGLFPEEKSQRAQANTKQQPNEVDNG